MTVAINTLPLRTQFALLKAIGKGQTVRSPIYQMQVQRRMPDVTEAVLDHAPISNLVEIDLQRDSRVRFSSKMESAKPEPRAKRPWLHAAPQGLTGFGIRLTTEGVRRLYALHDLVTTDEDEGRRIA